MRILGTIRASLGALHSHGESRGLPRLNLTNPVPHLGKGLSWPAACCPRQPDPRTSGQLKWEALRAGSSIPLEPPPSAQEGTCGTSSWVPSAPSHCLKSLRVHPRRGRKGWWGETQDSKMGLLTSDHESWRSNDCGNQALGPGLQPVRHICTPFSITSFWEPGLT